MEKKLRLLPGVEFDFSFGANVIAGIDEVGRGPWAGPVLACAVLIDKNVTFPIGVNDSKQLSKKNREFIYNQIINITDFGIGMVEVNEIDQMGIGKASKIAMQKAFKKLNKKVDLILLDGNDNIEFNCPKINIIRGDTKSVSIAAASIIAKVTRDKIMDNYSEIYPEYLWHKNSGYGTKQHIEAIYQHGLTPIHRKSFKPIQRYLGLIKND